MGLCNFEKPNLRNGYSDVFLLLLTYSMLCGLSESHIEIVEVFDGHYILVVRLFINEKAIL